MKPDGRPLRLLVIADAKLPVPPEGYGGTERMVALLCEGLAARGHYVTLMAAEGSRNYGRLIPHRWAGRKPYPYRAWCKIRFQALSLWAARNADAVVNFGRVDYLWGILRTQLPILCVFQNPIDNISFVFLLEHRKEKLIFIGVSDHQRRDFTGYGSWRTIHNSIDPKRFTFVAEATGSYLAFLGRLTRNKGVHNAIAVAKATGHRLKIAGNISDEPEGRAYFDAAVHPCLGRQIEWIGEVDHMQKDRFLGKASALLVPIEWDEPFGIVVPEALACGTPVIALERASMPELVRHGLTGFLCRTSDDMVDAVRRIGGIDRRACREDCEARFSADRMVEEYLAAIWDMLDDRACQAALEPSLR